jgi:methylase of polypeptide subunit release factors
VTTPSTQSSELAFEYIDCGGIEVAHLTELDGGGPRSWPHFVRMTQEHVGPVKHAYEWCAGPGYIGFALLGAGLCETLTVADINPDAVAACRETVRKNGLEDRVNVYLSDNLAGIPSDEKWDLIVGDPPHFPTPLQRHIDNGFVLRSVDQDWNIHREFFKAVPQHTKPGTHLVLTESRVAGNNDNLIIEMMQEAGFESRGPVRELPEITRYCLHAQVP